MKTLLFALALCLTGFFQTTGAQTLVLSAKLGFNSTTIAPTQILYLYGTEDSEKQTYSAKLGFTGGVGIQYAPLSFLGFSLDVLYSQRGANCVSVWYNRTKGFSPEDKTPISASFVDLPMQVKGLIGSERVKGTLGAGLNTHITLSTSDNILILNRVGFGFIGSLGVQVKVGDKLVLTGEGRYLHGLNDLKYSDTETRATRTFSFLVGVGIGF